MEISAIADDKTCTWLKMAGVSQTFPVSDPVESTETLKGLLKRIDIAIVLITPEIAQVNSKIVQDSLAKKDVFPIVLELPIGEVETGKQLQALISSALGVEFKV